jgi:hypothetical protein
MGSGFSAWTDELEARSLEPNGLNRKAVEKVWDKFEKGRAHWSRPWALVVAGKFL